MLIGKANYIYGDKSMSVLDVKILEPEKESDFKTCVTIGGEYNNESIIVNDLNQWEQLDALVRRAFDGLEE